eukprot:TRINITY_DN589_c0_g1_i1.p1 TRINITY_DN589_c0_g1~~TRINITY_DN589_c0_g1_i1.p1  ORF type:complete len:231 (+),score=29.72 TRINITY_DN589_c0_g1_i1:550-1242(+)
MTTPLPRASRFPHLTSGLRRDSVQIGLVDPSAVLLQQHHIETPSEPAENVDTQPSVNMDAQPASPLLMTTVKLRPSRFAHLTGGGRRDSVQIGLVNPTELLHSNKHLDDETDEMQSVPVKPTVVKPRVSKFMAQSQRRDSVQIGLFENPIALVHQRLSPAHVQDAIEQPAPRTVVKPRQSRFPHLTAGRRDSVQVGLEMPLAVLKSRQEHDAGFPSLIAHGAKPIHPLIR